MSLHFILSEDKSPCLNYVEIGQVPFKLLVKGMLSGLCDKMSWCLGES